MHNLFNKHTNKHTIETIVTIKKKAVKPTNIADNNDVATKPIVNTTVPVIIAPIEPNIKYLPIEQIHLFILKTSESLFVNNVVNKNITNPTIAITPVIITKFSGVGINPKGNTIPAAIPAKIPITIPNRPQLKLPHLLHSIIFIPFIIKYIYIFNIYNI